MGQPTESHQLFEAYLRENHIAGTEHQPDLGLSRRPDYRIVLDGYTCLCEIVRLASTSGSIPRSTAGRSPAEASLELIRSKVHEGARQLQPATGLGHALVVVLTNLPTAPVVLDDQEIVAALEGEAVVRAATPEVGSSARATARDRELRQVHPHVSAVVVMHPRPAQPDHAFAHAFIPNSDGAVPLPGVFFRGPHDQVWGYSFDDHCYVVMHDHGLDA